MPAHQQQRHTVGIGVLTPGFRCPYWGAARSVAEKEIREAGKHMIVASSCEGREGGEALALLREHGCGGVMMLGTHLAEQELVLAAGDSLATVIVDRHVRALAQDCFSVNHHKSAAMVADYLLGRGHSKFAVVTGPLCIEAARQKLEGFSAGVAQASLTIDQSLVFQGAYTLESGRRVAEAFLRTGLPFTALFCGNDEMAVGAKSVLDRAGRKVEVFGYENIAPWNELETGINSVAVPIENIVANACAHLLNKCDGGNRPVQRRFEAELVIRSA